MAYGQKVVAIIDDEPAVRDSLATLIKSLGYRAEVYGSGEEFIKAALSSEAGCLLVDIHLGDITGFELIRHILSMGLLLPVVFMTGSQEAGLRKEAGDFGCVAFLLKPFPASDLAEVIEEAIGKANAI